MINGEQMKNRFFKSLIVIMLLCCFVLTGCVSMGEGTEPDPDLLDTAENADDILKLKDNTTTYTDKDGNEDVYLFNDALVFIDPGANGKFYDHFKDDEETTFKNLVDREITNLSDWIATALYGFYGLSAVSTDIEYKDVDGNTLSTPSPVTSLYDYTDDWDGDSEKIDFNNYDYFLANTGLSTDVTLPKVDIVGNSEDYLKLAGGMFGGYELQAVEKTVDESNVTYYTYTDSETLRNNTGSPYVWDVISNSNTLTSSSSASTVISYISNKIGILISCAVAGVSVPNNFGTATLNEFYNSTIQKIDHLGFTGADLHNITEHILDNIVGEGVVDADNDCRPEEINSERTLDKTIINDAGKSEDRRRYYKGYDIVVPQIIECLAGATYQETGSGETDLTKKSYNVFFKFPRISIMSVDIEYILDAEMPETEGEGEEIGDSGFEVPDMDPSTFEDMETTLNEKFDEPINLVGFLFMPNDIIGTRTMAKKENGEWVYKDEDKTEVDTKTFDIEGFLVSSSEIALITEEGKSAVVEATTKVVSTRYDAETMKNVTTTMEKTTEQMDVYSTKPEAGDDNFSYAVEFFDAMTLLKSEETDEITSTSGDVGTLESFRMGAYDGIQLAVAGTMGVFTKFDEFGMPSIISTMTGVASENGKYVTFSLSTSMHKYISVDDINGEDVDEELRTYFAGYKLNLNNFAGNNYVQIDINVLAVDDDTENREVKLNLLTIKIDDGN